MTICEHPADLLFGSVIQIEHTSRNFGSNFVRATGPTFWCSRGHGRRDIPDSCRRRYPSARPFGGFGQVPCFDTKPLRPRLRRERSDFVYLTSIYEGERPILPMIDLPLTKQDALPRDLWGLIYEDWKPDRSQGVTVFLEGLENSRHR